MTTKAADNNPAIDVNLEEDPELNILAWRLQVQEVASGLATTVAPTGLLTHILDDAEWDNHLANRSVSPNGTVGIVGQFSSCV